MGRPSFYLPRESCITGWLSGTGAAILEEARAELQQREHATYVSDGNAVEYALREWKRLRERKKLADERARK